MALALFIASHLMGLNNLLTNNKYIGQTGETIAARYLKKNGYDIIEQNYRQKFGEIDIIASKAKQLIFVEVKTRTGKKFGSPDEAVTVKKQQQIIKVAMFYLAANDITDTQIRFDVIAVSLSKTKEPVINHIEHGFIPQQTW